MNSLKILIPAEKIANRIQEIAKRLNSDYSDKSNVVIVCVLKGSFLFAADLVRELDFNYEIAFIEISSYGKNTSSGKLQLISEMNTDLNHKNIIIIEDIIDTGNTLNFLESYLFMRGAKNIEVVTLLIKSQKFVSSCPVKYFGFEIEDIFVAGYGMDYREKYRNLPNIVVVDSSISSEK